jgi:hypothetical protein
LGVIGAAGGAVAIAAWLSKFVPASAWEQLLRPTAAAS